MAFHPHYWDTPVKNGSRHHNYAEWNATSRQAAAQFISLTRQAAQARGADGTGSSDSRGSASGLDRSCCSRQRQHALRHRARTRFSIDFRSVHIDDVAQHGSGEHRLRLHRHLHGRLPARYRLRACAGRADQDLRHAAPRDRTWPPRGGQAVDGRDTHRMRIRMPWSPAGLAREPVAGRRSAGPRCEGFLGSNLVLSVRWTRWCTGLRRASTACRFRSNNLDPGELLDADAVRSMLVAVRPQVIYHLTGYGVELDLEAVLPTLQDDLIPCVTCSRPRRRSDATEWFLRVHLKSRPKALRPRTFPQPR